MVNMSSKDVNDPSNTGVYIVTVAKVLRVNGRYASWQQ